MHTLQTIKIYFDLHYEELNDAAYHLVNNKKLAQEITGKAFLEACEHRQEIVPDEALEAFMHNKIKEVAETENAKEQKRLDMIGSVLFVEPKTTKCSFDRSQITTAVLRAADEEIVRLTPRYRDIINYYLQKTPTRQIAKIVNLKRQTVRNIKGKIIRQIQEAICARGLL